MEFVATGFNPEGFAIMSADALLAFSLLLHTDVRTGHGIGLFFGLSVNEIDIPAGLGLNLLYS